MSLRFDTGTIENFLKTREGFLTVVGYPTRTGVFRYRNPDGSERRELRHPDDVFREDSLETLAGKPLTVYKHPQQLVTPDTVGDVGVGSVNNEIRVTGDGLIKVVFNVHRGDGVQAIEKDGCTQLSCGYTCDIEQVSGTYKGERYDCRQRNIIYNHVTALQLGRAGEMCSLRFDGVDRQDVGYQVSAQTLNRSPRGNRKMAQIDPQLLDGVRFDDADMPDGMAIKINDKLRAALAEKERNDALEAEVEDLQQIVQQLSEQKDFQEGRADRLEEAIEERDSELAYLRSDAKGKKKSEEDDDEEYDDSEMFGDEDPEDDEEEDPVTTKYKGKKKGRKDSADFSYDAIRAEIEQEFRTRADAQALLSQYNIDAGDILDGDAHEIRLKAIKAINPNLNLDGKSDAYVEARFDSLLESEVRTDAAAYHANSLMGDINRARKTGEGDRRDGGGLSPRDQNRANAYKNPGTMSKAKI